MKPKIHPEYKEITVTCSCGNTFVTRSTLDKKQITLEVCSMCHPFYTGTQKLVDTGGRVDRFRQKYAKKAPTTEAIAGAKPEIAEKEKGIQGKKEEAAHKVKAAEKVTKEKTTTKKKTGTKKEVKKEKS